jgi:hypothetical protein
MLWGLIGNSGGWPSIRSKFGGWPTHRFYFRLRYSTRRETKTQNAWASPQIHV